MTDASDPHVLSSRPVEPPPAPPSLSVRELARWAWRQLTSMRTALILLLLLGLAAVPGSLVPQERVDALAVARWKTENPDLTPVYERIGLFQVYGSVWFSAIYILLMVSLVGCILPRLRIYWRAASAPPPTAPRHLQRLPESRRARMPADPAEVADGGQRALRRGRFRVRTTEIAGVYTISAQRGYLREAGNLLFHSSLVVVLIAFAVGDLFGFRGGVIVVEGQSFTNASQSYDDFVPGALFDSGHLEPFTVTLDDFKASFLTSGPQTGQPTEFRADITYRTSPAAGPASTTLEVNKPLTVGDTSVFLVGNGFAPVVTVRDGNGDVAFSGPIVFLPQDTTYASFGVIKVPDARPEQLAFEGLFLPTYGYDKSAGPYSRFPDALAPALSLNLYTGDLGLSSGVPQSVYTLDKDDLTAVRDRRGDSRTFTIARGRTQRLPGGGSITFDGVERWAKLQVASTPAEPIALGGVVLGLVGLLGSLFVRPRRVWLRIHPGEGGSEVEVAGLDRLDGDGLDRALDDLLDDIRRNAV